MIDILRRVEEKLVRAEGWLLVFLVGLMLLLAVYNVIYRNALVPLQAKLTLDDSPTAAVPAPVPEPAPTPGEPAATDKPVDEGFGGGFGGGFGAQANDSAEGFGGGFGGDFAGDKANSPPQPDAKADEGFGGGFGGDFGGDPQPAGADKVPTPAPQKSDEGFGGDFGGDFGGAAANEPAEKKADEGFGGDFGGDFAGEKPAEPQAQAPSVPANLPEVAPVAPRELSPLAKFVDDFVHAVKLEWIDVLLRHLVLVVGFLGAMLATQRRKHITIDALSKVVPAKFLPWIEATTAALSGTICAFLAVSGADLVAISREFPKELMSWADEWMFQLVFPIGFGLLCFHFFVRVVESIGHGLSAREKRGAA